jgi:hypothetical protein
MSIFIIYKDGNLLGYLNDVESAKKAVQDLSVKIAREISAEKNVRVSYEYTENGVRILTQEIGKYINGLVYTAHEVTWCVLPKFCQESMEFKNEKIVD